MERLLKYQNKLTRYQNEYQTTNQLKVEPPQIVNYAEMKNIHLFKDQNREKIKTVENKMDPTDGVSLLQVVIINI